MQAVVCKAAGAAISALTLGPFLPTVLGGREVAFTFPFRRDTAGKGMATRSGQEVVVRLMADAIVSM